MPKIVNVRPVLLSARYAFPEYLEVKVNLKSGHRTCGLVEITLEDGTTGLGEGYLAVFAPHVFAETVKLVAPYLVGQEVMDVNARYRDLCAITGYWSFQGAARHVVSACEIALVDAKAKHLDVPACSLFGGKAVDAIPLYGSGGDSAAPPEMMAELDLLASLGISLFKIRAENHEVAKTVWCLEQAGQRGIGVAVDMCQNLANPAQTVGDVARYLSEVHSRTARRIVFLEEALGPMDTESYRALRSKLDVKLCGGEIITTAAELCRRVEDGLYDFVQPDATVIGGMGQVKEVFSCCRQHGSEAVVHCWGGAVGMTANYHIAFAEGGRLLEYPMPEFPLRREMLVEPLAIENGKLKAPLAPGLGVLLTPEIEAKYAFREEAVYTCLEAPTLLPDDSVWAATCTQALVTSRV